MLERGSRGLPRLLLEGSRKSVQRCRVSESRVFGESTHCRGVVCGGVLLICCPLETTYGLHEVDCVGTSDGSHRFRVDKGSGVCVGLRCSILWLIVWHRGGSSRRIGVGASGGGGGRLLAFGGLQFWRLWLLPLPAPPAVIACGQTALYIRECLLARPGADVHIRYMASWAAASS